MPRRPTSISAVSWTGPSDAVDRRRLGRVVRQHVAQPAELVRIVPVHPHPEPDRLLGLARRVGQDALLAQRHELGDAVGLDVALARESQVALDVDLHPETLAVEPVLPALGLAEHGVVALEDVLVGPAPGVVDAHRVVRRDRTVEEAPARAGGVLGTKARERLAVAPHGEDLVLLGDQVRLRADGLEHSASRLDGCGRAACTQGAGVRNRRPEYPTRDARPAGRATARTVAVRGGISVASLPGTRPPVRRRAQPGAGLRGRADPGRSRCWPGSCSDSTGSSSSGSP